MKRVFEHRVVVYPAWDKRNEKGGYGQHCAEIHFVVRYRNKELGFAVYTGWYVEAANYPLSNKETSMGEVHGASLYAHSKSPFRGAIKRNDYCDVFKSNCCYENALTFITEDLLKILILEGSEKLFEELEKRYVKFFSKEKGD